MNRFTNHYLELPSHFYRHIDPEPLVDARLVHYNQTLAEQLRIRLENSQVLQLTAGQAMAPGLEPLAQKYTGHQFGYYNPDLGDGRGLLLGQAIDSENRSWDLHLKGAGITPYSRRGDGRAVLRSAVREYLIGEALHHLNIPTTRCLSLCHSPEPVRREKIEDRASYIRVAKTHVRFGHFEWLAQRGDRSDFEQMANYVVEVVYPELIDEPPAKRYAELFRTICIRTAELIAKWQAAGFCHGVMNSDNMSVAGETFDFGPYAFLDDFKIHHICNHSDTEGRYAYSQQPNIGLWNCQVLGQAFSMLLSSEQIEQGLDAYVIHYNEAYLHAMGSKFGLPNLAEGDKYFIADSLILMDKSDIDFHHFFHHLGKLESEQEHQWLDFVGDSKAWREWRQTYLSRTEQIDREQRRQQIAEQTASFVLRNHIAQEIIESCEGGDYDLLSAAMAWLQTPFSPPADLRENYAHFLQAPREEQKGIALSCSS
ncbi:protein adenylyltransferase SelO family protein [Thiomicrorhabdus sp. 6S3-12]|uniref:protein adenylyltransferase SelO n=1 Tax=Thiomicrorhabdus sp. 6S3-12 TaxID=2819681 RepID=UPI001AACC6DD|nr:YdiU family protein [Thiomicrorhabdus sp. 6S3-12]